MFFGYNTNGFAHHRLEDTIEILAQLGYRGLALTVDYHTINVLEHESRRRVSHFRDLLQQHALQVVVETGARFLLDPRRKHQPTLVSSEPSEQIRRLIFLKNCAALAVELGSETVSFWSGTPDQHQSRERLMDQLVGHCQSLCEFPIRWAFEPEPGMFIDRMHDYQELFERVDRANFGLTLDVGHLQCNGELPISRYLQTWKDRLWNIHIEDMVQGIHDHRMFGEGEIDFSDVFKGLRDIDYQHGVFVELSRHSHDAVQVAKRSIEFLQSKSVTAINSAAPKGL